MRQVDATTPSRRYDAQGRRLFADYGRGVTVSYEYAGPTDEWTAIEGPTFGRVTRRFSSGGRLLSSTMPNGDTTTRVYDALGRVRVETAPNGAITRYHYDAAGRLERLEDEARGVSTRYEHDAAGRVTATIDHLGHRTESPRDLRGGMAAYEDATGRRWEMTDTGRSSISTDPLGNTTTSTRGEYGLPGATTYPGGASTDVSFLGQTSTDASGDYPLSRIDELGRARQYTYDPGGALSTATDLGGTDAWAYDYVPVVGGDIRFDVGSGRVWLDTITHRRADATVIASVDYQRTDSGEPTRVDREDGSYVLLGYDAALRLTSEAYHDATDTLVETIAYTYDRDGNRTSRTTSAGEETYAYTSGSRLTGITRGGADLTTYAYDDAGPVLTRRYDTRDQTLSWDADDHVVALTEGTTELTYDFDAAGRRVRREARVAGAIVAVDRWQVAPTGVDELESPHLVTAGVNVQSILANLAVAVARELFRAVVRRVAGAVVSDTLDGLAIRVLDPAEVQTLLMGRAGKESLGVHHQAVIRDAELASGRAFRGRGRHTGDDDFCQALRAAYLAARAARNFNTASVIKHVMKWAGCRQVPP